ncbi:hypothetical protein G9F72_023925 [Clostridium estertheticum]|uniref:hypothetical protein n=1 Tax=Clostridium estertheticum TaxID=238834 RepID=UPI0013E94807|nr:hypothetical protein [Clostridium estertheticum]MBZ9689349.1 hypothetical protein [Clostridium estertheticum]
MIRRKNASSIGIIGNPDETTLKFLKTWKKIRKIVRKGKTKIVIGKGLFRKTIKID